MARSFFFVLLPPEGGHSKAENLRCTHCCPRGDITVTDFNSGLSLSDATRKGTQDR